MLHGEDDGCLVGGTLLSPFYGCLWVVEFKVLSSQCLLVTTEVRNGVMFWLVFLLPFVEVIYRALLAENVLNGAIFLVQMQLPSSPHCIFRSKGIICLGSRGQQISGFPRSLLGS